MRAYFILVAGLTATFIAWLAGTELRWPARALMSFLVGLLPALSVAQANAAASLPELPSRLRLYTSTIIALWALTFLTAFVASASGFNPRLMRVVEVPVADFMVWATAATAGIGAVVLLFKAFGSRETRMLQHLVPQTPKEKLVFVGVSLTAAICEETIFRGFLMAAVHVASGSLPFAVIVSAGAFGVAHAHQDASGAIRAALLGMVLTVPVLATGSLYPAIAAHAIADLAGGLWLAKWLIRS